MFTFKKSDGNLFLSLCFVFIAVNKSIQKATNNQIEKRHIPNTVEIPVQNNIIAFLATILHVLTLSIVT